MRIDYYREIDIYYPALIDGISSMLAITTENNFDSSFSLLIHWKYIGQKCKMLLIELTCV